MEGHGIWYEALGLALAFWRGIWRSNRGESMYGHGFFPPPKKKQQQKLPKRNRIIGLNGFREDDDVL